MSGRKRKLSKSTRKLMAELIVTPLVTIKYMTYNSDTNNYSGWVDVYCDGTNIYEIQTNVPVSKTTDPFMNYNFLQPLQNYVLKATNNPNVIVYDYRRTSYYKPILNRKHPWYKALRQ